MEGHAPHAPSPAGVAPRRAGGVPSRQVMVSEPGPRGLLRRPDRLAVEEPLQVQLSGPGGASTLGVTMRTPGHDMELVAGLLLAEGIIDGRDDLAGITYCSRAGGGSASCTTVAVPAGVTPNGTSRDGTQRQPSAGGLALQAPPVGRDGFNTLTVKLRRAPRRPVLERRTVTSSSCGVCGSASIEALRSAGHPPIGDGPAVSVAWVCALPAELRRHQRSFDETGSVHAAGLADPATGMLAVREDVGRHNAVDKAIGWALLDGRLPLADVALVVSGRVSFEIVQKAVRAGVGLVVAVSGATSLAVELAADTGVTLAGFVRDGRCTVYAGTHRLVPG